MYNTFYNFDELLCQVNTDKNASGSQAFTANRYPVRFVLFDNFRDSYSFVEKMQSEYGCQVESIEHWFDEPHVDILFTHSKLAKQFKQFVNVHQDKDYVVTPFSELIRFYDNDKYPEFHTLVATIKGIENDGNPAHRIYVPIVGLEGKFSQFDTDSQIFVWYFNNNALQLNYRLVVTNGSDYGVRHLEEKYTVIHNMKEWLQVWRNQNALQQIISLSPSIASNIQFAQPDNAFTYCSCHNVYEFLTNGLGLSFGDVTYKEKEEHYWLRLAQEVNILDFSFEKFFNTYFHIDDLADYTIFLKTWFECKDEFEKWLLCNYYVFKFCNEGYLCKVIHKSTSYIDYQFFSELLLDIFEEENPEKYLVERTTCLNYAAQKGVMLSQDSEEVLRENLCRKAGEIGYISVLQYFTTFTNTEKFLLIEWIGQEFIKRDSIENVFPELYNYLGNEFRLDGNSHWLEQYLKAYRNSKIKNCYTDEIRTAIAEKNASEVSFNGWYQDFKTVKTILNNRADIEVFYWIDGLGVEWIPFISQLVNKKPGMFLNEVHVARAHYPTTTFNNRNELQELSDNTLEKIGDLDSYAHKSGSRYPEYIWEEMQIVEEAVNQILNNYAGKRIAIVSDHGLTALSQFCDGLNLKGYSYDHSGRLAISDSGMVTFDTAYVKCEDAKTICALRHESLGNKIPIGQSAHGGCTPEEILVPIFVISDKENAAHYQITLQTKEISAINAVAIFKIKGLGASDKPYLMYAKHRYELSKKEERYYSEKMTVNTGNDTITVFIGTYKETFRVKINTGAEEEDPFVF